MIAERLGLDAKRYSGSAGGYGDGDEDRVNYVPQSMLEDAERFKACPVLQFACSTCKSESEFAPQHFGLSCPNAKCRAPLWGAPDAASLFARLSNKVVLDKRRHVGAYYSGWLRCDDPSCGIRTKQVTVWGGACLSGGCQGVMRPEQAESAVYTQLKYAQSIFASKHAKSCCAREGATATDRAEVGKLCGILSSQTTMDVESNAYNWISSGMFGVLAANKGLAGSKKLKARAAANAAMVV